MRKVLVANRGEIAVRVIHACADAGVASVAVYADGDLGALHTELADEAYALQGTSAAETYLDARKLLRVARRCGADGVHPGYGFLAEDADFAQAVIDAGLTWIGPPPSTIRLLGDKLAARALARRVGAPLAVGTDGPVTNAAAVRAFAEEHGLPVVLKAAFGGGGRGLRVVGHLDDVEEAFSAVTNEGRVAFGRSECFVEQLLDRPRHVEAQILADGRGNVVVLGTRDCSLQRRHQKLVEEAPAPFLTDHQRAAVVEGARAICAEAGYVGAGTVEFLLAADGMLSFLEVNTRLQVEHPVTELTTGVDLVLAQLAIAAGDPLPVTTDPVPVGHAIELRINAEDVGRGFLPATGEIAGFTAPSGPGVRVDTGVRPGSVVGAEFDSLLAKIVVHGADRAQALRRARRAVAETRISGVATVLPFHRAVLSEPAFTGADRLGIHTRWIEEELATRVEPDPDFAQGRAAPVLRRVPVEIDGRRVLLGLPPGLLSGPGRADGERGPQEATAGSASDALTAPVGGSVVRWLVEPGSTVDDGAAVVVLEAMKMETTVGAPRAGVLGQHRAQAGQQVIAGQVLAEIADA